ncbi:T9SS type A sorting domain-containing protein [Larkinella sp. VNQ87]|uniref:T9SS type A sorting domain-containing protein n=1 Tax=Larkinella sp. VNQ87 TaxID=3400921 RepID=UPI003C0CBDF7
MATFLLNLHRIIRVAFRSGFNCYLLSIYLLLSTAPLLFGQSFSVHTDPNGFYQTTKTAPNRASAARKAHYGVITFKADPRRPANSAVVSISIDQGVPLDDGLWLTLSYKSSTGLRDPANEIIIANKIIDRISRRVEIPLSGLNENTTYYFNLIYWHGCTGEQAAQAQYKTGVASSKPKKVLLVLDKPYQNDPQIEQALAVYKADATRADPNLVFEPVYLSTDPAEKGLLYELIKNRYYDADAPLHYLFFIGRNAPATIRSEVLNHKTHQVLPGRHYFHSSIAVYAKVSVQDFPFDGQENTFVNRRYDCQLVGNDLIPNDRSNGFYQYSGVDVSYGALIPTRPEEGKDYILRYFDKLHRYKTGQIKFDKKVLLADTQLYDGSLPRKIEQLTGRWTGNDTINVPKKYGGDFHGFDPVWKEDYLKKLGANSYEIAYYTGHGSPGLHYYGITPTEINGLPQLKTLLFDFASCSVGDITARDYLAGVYLDKGNTLFVNAFSTPIGIVSYDNESPLLEKFKENQVFNLFTKGRYSSDAYRYGYTTNIVQFYFGDPLLLLDPPCTSTDPLAITSTGSLSLCPGDSVTLRLPATFTNYRWFRNEQEISGVQTATLVAKQGGFYSAKARQCDQEVSSPQSVTITLKPGPETPVITVEPFPDRFRLRVTPTGKFTSFNWFLNGERWTETTRDTVVAAFLGEYTVRVTQDGCSVVSKPVSVAIETPVLTVTGPNPACAGDSLVVKAPENFSAYTWLTKDGPTVVTTSNVRTFNQNTAVAVSPKRGSLAGPTSAYVTLAFKPKPPKPTVTLESDGFRSSSPVNNQWYRNGQPLPDSTRQVLRNPGAGTYHVRVTQEGCYNESAPMILTTIEPAVGRLRVYPNPAKELFWIEWPGGFRAGTLEVIDNLGRTVYRRSYDRPPSGALPVSLKTAPGLYFLRFSSADQVQTVKLVVGSE